MRTQTASPERLRHDGALGACCILLLTAVMALMWSHARLLWNDEFLSFFGDASPTAADVVRVQLRTPISLDPPTYHLLSHWSMGLLGRDATALRLPALAGFLLLQVCLFVLVRRLAGARAALVAMALPLLTASFRYAVEGRPYGLLLGLNAAALLCWDAAAQRKESATSSPSPTGRRALPLLGLVLAIVLAMTSHYFGLLILVPIAIGEGVRSLQRKRLDTPLAATIAAAAIVGLASILPFRAALKPYQQHYYTGSVNLRNVSQGYRELFVRYGAWSVAAQRVAMACLLAGGLLLLLGAVRRFRQRPLGEPASLWAALCGLAALPFCGYLCGKFVTHTMEVRYVIAALIPFAVVIALLLAPRLRSRAVFTAVLAAVLVAAVALTGWQIVQERATGAATLASLQAPTALHAELAAHPGEPLYTQSLSDFFLLSYYAPDPLVRERLRYLYDDALEVRWLHHDTNAVTAEYLPRFTPLRVAPFSTFAAQPTALLLWYGTGWEWIEKELIAEGRPQQFLGNALHGGELIRVGSDR